MNHKFYFGSLPKTTLKTELSWRGKLEKDTKRGSNAAGEERRRFCPTDCRLPFHCLPRHQAGWSFSFSLGPGGGGDSIALNTTDGTITRKQEQDTGKSSLGSSNDCHCSVYQPVKNHFVPENNSTDIKWQQLGMTPIVLVCIGYRKQQGYTWTYLSFWLMTFGCCYCWWGLGGEESEDVFIRCRLLPL